MIYVSLLFPIVFKWLKCVHIGLLSLFSEWGLLVKNPFEMEGND